jgi:hypothetical protein
MKYDAATRRSSAPSPSMSESVGVESTCASTYR